MAITGFEHWKSEKLEDICSHITDGKHGDCLDEPGSGYYFLSCKDVTNEKLNYEGARQITKTDFLDTHRRTRFAPGDVLITNSGTIGRMAIARNNELTHRTTFQKSVAILKSIPTRVDPNFLYYAIQGDIRRLIEFAGGTAQKNLLLRDIRAFEIRIPPLHIQRRIADILSAYDDLIENSQRRIKILESMARALYREWFVRENGPGSVIAQLPVNGRLGDLCHLTKESFAEQLHSDWPLLDLSRMSQRCIAPAETRSANELTTSRIIFEPGDTLFGAIRCYLHKVNMAHFPGVTNTSVLVLRPKTAAFRSLLAILASDVETIRWADTHSTGTKMPVINWSVLNAMPAPVPSESLASAFEELAGPMLDQIGVIATQIQNLRRARDLLLPRLLSGQIDVEVA